MGKYDMICAPNLTFQTIQFIKVGQESQKSIKVLRKRYELKIEMAKFMNTTVQKEYKISRELQKVPRLMPDLCKKFGLGFSCDGT